MKRDSKILGTFERLKLPPSPVSETEKRSQSYRITADFTFPDRPITPQEFAQAFFPAMSTAALPPGRVTIVACEPRPFVGHIIDAVPIERKVEFDETTESPFEMVSRSKDATLVGSKDATLDGSKDAPTDTQESPFEMVTLPGGVIEIREKSVSSTEHASKESEASHE